MTITPLGNLLLFYMCIYLPFRAINVFWKIPDFEPQRGSATRYLYGIRHTVVHTALALWTARGCRIHVFGSNRIDLVAVTAVAVFLLVALGALQVEWRCGSPVTRKRLWSVTPVTRRERLLWFPISLLVGVGEEIIWRGVTFNLLLMFTGSAWAAAFISAAVFGLCHVSQGWIAVGVASVMALGLQSIVEITGGLYAAMVAHILYNLVAGLLTGAWGMREFGVVTPSAATEPAPADPTVYGVDLDHNGRRSGLVIE